MGKLGSLVRHANCFLVGDLHGFRECRRSTSSRLLHSPHTTSDWLLVHFLGRIRRTLLVLRNASDSKPLHGESTRFGQAKRRVVHVVFHCRVLFLAVARGLSGRQFPRQV